MPERRLPDKEVLLQWRRNGLTYKQIAKKSEELTGYLPTEAAVGMALNRAGVTTSLKVHGDLVPWTVKRDHSKNYDYRLLLKESRRRNGLPASQNEYEAKRFERILDNWLKWLATPEPDGSPAAPLGWVLHYEPSSPKGFYYVPKIPEDGDSIIRHPDVEEERLRREAS